MKPNINTALAEKLIAAQFPHFANLSIRSVEYQGHDNRTFHLGDEMLIRMPSAEEYTLSVLKEHEWLPKIKSHISLTIPEPIAMGKPSDNYPWQWSIYQWIEGNSINTLNEEEIDHTAVALQLAQFLKELHQIDISDTDTIIPGSHNGWRGDHVSVYGKQARQQIVDLKRHH